MKINYNKLTTEQLEEHVEFIDWSLVPSHLITDDVKKLFGSMPQLNARLWFEDLISKMVIKEDKKRYPDYIFFFIGEEYYMDYYLKSKRLHCSFELIWLFLESKVGYDHEDVRLFIKNIVKLYFKKKEITPMCAASIRPYLLEQHFKMRKEISKNNSLLDVLWIKQESSSKYFKPPILF